MYHDIHGSFIREPIRSILTDGINACRGIGEGIQTAALKDYFLSSIFLRMTGAQEQKLKCICWEIATHNYDFRYEYMKKSLGDSSDYEIKKRVFNYLKDQLQEGSQVFTVTQDEKNCIIEETLYLQELFKKSDIVGWAEKDFDWYNRNIKECLDPKQILVMGNKGELLLFESKLKEDFDLVVKNNRNSLAHNTTSYLRNLSKFELMATQDYDRCNYFYRYSLLVLIDLIFIFLYEKYRERIENDSLSF